MHAPQVKSTETKLIEDLRGTTFRTPIQAKLATETVAFSSELTGQSKELQDVEFVSEQQAQVDHTPIN